jgi:Insertion element 4 transposase N-terminal
MVYFVMPLARFAGEDYEEVATRLTETLASSGCWDDSWSVPISGGINQARQRLGPEPLELWVLAGVATPGTAPWCYPQGPKKRTFWAAEGQGGCGLLHHELAGVAVNFGP